ncbi:transposase [Nitrosospira sp. Nl5]|uniref:integrase core domain-containing protein n=1 Tax=Nitrosospira sp. Nl5 TaxID=200120 RepID=UPI003524AB07
MDFSRLGKPTENCHIETFNRSFRDECLNLHWLETLEEAKVIIDDWRRDYNESRPHTTLNDPSSTEFVRPSAFQALSWLNQGGKLTLGMAPGTKADQWSGNFPFRPVLILGAGHNTNSQALCWCKEGSICGQ